MSDAPQRYEDVVGEVRVLTQYDAFADRWTTVVIGGAMDGWSATYRADVDDPAVRHLETVERAREAQNAERNP